MRSAEAPELIDSNQNLCQGLAADFHADVILGIEILISQIRMDEENLQDVASDRIAAFVCEPVKRIFHLNFKVVPVLNVGLISGKILITKPVSEEYRCFFSACTLVLL